ncbi:MAG: phosphatidate cytidylyltransferase [Clostridia bacterium]|nr:phosphatidate cytidylyltransferase [Clostridia bacterium]
MIKRILTASVLIACLVGIFFLRTISDLFFDALLFVLIIGSIYELVKAFEKIGTKVNLVGLIVYVALYGIGYYFVGLKGIFFALVLAMIVILTCFTFSTKRNINDLLASLFVMVYPSLFLSFAFELNHNASGLLLILLVIVISVFTDTFAYFVGSIVKGKKLCPKISPKKTISGAIGGFIGGILGSILIYFCFEVWGVFGVQSLGFSNPILIYILIGAVGAVFDEVGDLVSSQIKRKTGIKDFGNIFPGHGGILDRIDGMSFVLAGVGILYELLVVAL